jgi:predicted small lipoprotein YifL
MKKLMLLLVIALALPACGKKTPPPASAGDTQAEPATPDEPAPGGDTANPCAEGGGTPVDDPCAAPAKTP